MDVKAAVDSAKRHIADLFAEEQVSNIGLEEVEHDEASDQWRITIGFSRPWEHGGQFDFGSRGATRTYKVVTIDRTGHAISVKNRDVADAG